MNARRLPSARLLCLAFLLGVWLPPWSPAAAQENPPPAIEDKRHEPLKDLDGYFPFEPARSPEAWRSRERALRQRILVTQGLWPKPATGSLNAVVHGRRDMGDYTIEKAYFETLPGFFTTGSLYRPKTPGPHPGVLCPHGHWANGRFHDAGEAAAAREIQQGAEVDPEAARSPLQARCVQLARMGCVVFHYDMIGYADSRQISFEIAHRFAQQRPEMNRDENWGLYSPQAESRFQHVMGLQTLSSMRALDFLESLPDVDSSRLAVTGASGGGTQTFMLAALDPRVAAAFPAVMVSTAMQGGCTCENACGLRVETGNIELAALFAPKPLGLTAANDWTKEMETKGFPELKRHYAALGAPDNVMLSAHTEFGHNYNYVSRRAMYEWFNKHLKLGADSPIEERPFQRLTAEELTVWDAEHPAPPAGEEEERRIVAWLERDAREQREAPRPGEPASLSRFQQQYRPHLQAVIGRTPPPQEGLRWENTAEVERGQHVEFRGRLLDEHYQEATPAVFLHPLQWKGAVVLWLSEQGLQAVQQADGSPTGPAQRLLDQGIAVAGVELFTPRESESDGDGRTLTRKVGNPREFAGYTFGYNHALFAQRVHDVVRAASYISRHEQQPQRVLLAALDRTGPIAAAARGVLGELLQGAAIDSGGFRFAGVNDWRSPEFLPGAAKLGDLPAMLALEAPRPLWVRGEPTEELSLVSAAYEAVGQAAALRLAGESGDAAAWEWLLQQASGRQ